MRRALEHGPEPERLNNVFGARLRITTLRAEDGPGIELLEYLAPRDGRPAPADARSNDLAHRQTALVARDAEAVYPLLRKSPCAVLSPGAVASEGRASDGERRSASPIPMATCSR